MFLVKEGWNKVFRLAINMTDYPNDCIRLSFNPISYWKNTQQCTLAMHAASLNQTYSKQLWRANQT